MNAPTVQHVLEKHSAAWTLIDGVLGATVGQRDGLSCIKVYIADDADPQKIRAHVPQSIEGHPIMITRIGHLRAV